MSRYGATLTILATTLSEAAVKDGRGSEDIEFFLSGKCISEWLRSTAEAISGDKRPVPLPDWFCSIADTPEVIRCKHFEGPNTCLNKNLCSKQVPF